MVHISYQHLRHILFPSDTEYEEIGAGNISNESLTEPAQGIAIERQGEEAETRLRRQVFKTKRMMALRIRKSQGVNYYGGILFQVLTEE